MALEVETGSGSATAESYASVADADAWHAGRGITLWAPLLTAEKEQALRRATGHIEQVYRMHWAGWRVSATQALSWPRYSVPMLDGPGAYAAWPNYYPSNSVPGELRNACAELAFKAAAGDLAPDIGRLTSREKVDVIEVEYQRGASPWVRYRSIENMLAPLFKSATMGTSIGLVRA